MFLRSITIRGFKSFADKTVLEFVPGTSVIVGPNGSGKSNLVDAISWALGEQGPRALRGGQMADVIFAGTPSRPALGMAEVKLVIDNTAGMIPVPMTEIEISRTIFRSGESEYRIGGQVVRLLDVQELLAESGIGRALHTVVGQGQLEEVLLARPEDRRRYIEEAAGIAKHRKRKERAERKLAGLDHDLVRLTDVLAELKRQLKPLAQQAEMAKKHETLTARADELARKLSAARLRALVLERERRSDGWDRGLAERAEARSALDALDADVLSAADARATAAAALHGAERRARATTVDRDEADRRFRAALEAEAEARELVTGAAAAAARLASVAGELERVDAQLTAAVQDLAARERELDEAEAAFQAADQQRRDAEEARRHAGEAAAARRGEFQLLERSVADATQERARLLSQLEQVRQRIADIDAERTALGSDIERLDGQTAPLEAKRSQLDAERRAAVERVEELDEARRRMQARKDLLDARRADIAETPGSRFLGRHRGAAAGLLKDLVQVDAGLERALVAALGSLADAVVYEDGARALADAPEGDGAILAISSGGPVPSGLTGERSLLSAVRAEPAARGIVATVLRDVYLAGSLEEAVAKQREHPRVSFVTVDGVLIGQAVIHTARETDGRLREIEAELQVLAHDLSANEQQRRPRAERIIQIADEVAFLREQIEAADAEITAAAERLSASEHDLVAAGREEAMLSSGVEALDERLRAWRDRITAIGPEPAAELPALPPIARPPITARVAVETARHARGQLDQRLTALRREHDDLASRDAVAAREAVEGAEAARSAAEAGLGAADGAAHEAAEARDTAAAAEREAAEREAAVNKAWRDASTRLERLREAYEDDDRARGDIERRIEEATRMLREGFGADPDEVIATLADDDSVESLGKAQELVQRRLALLGRVNLLATGEFEVVQERYDLMHRELDDVRRARRDLLELVAQIDRDITEAFTAAFHDVAVQFERLIAELFPGGEGRLILTDPADPLASGIEIEASPGRKRVKRISLLSGGERSLTALAFLFAIFTARPSPFYLMDEVEPALDDVNLHRFLKLIDGFAADSQVLIVTHQKRTMEIAGMMYGISLNADGTTKVVAQLLDQRDRPADRPVVDVRETETPEAASPAVDVPHAEPVG
jgi:chromosome segregation protein